MIELVKKGEYESLSKIRVYSKFHSLKGNLIFTDSIVPKNKTSEEFTSHGHRAAGVDFNGTLNTLQIYFALVGKYNTETKMIELALAAKESKANKKKKVSPILLMCNPGETVHLQIDIEPDEWKGTITVNDTSKEYTHKLKKKVKLNWATDINWYFDSPVTQNYILYKELLSPYG